MNLPDFTEVEQAKLANAKILVVGAGGLGSPLILYLAAAGIGHLGIIDFDKVEIHNLHRQILYTSVDIGKYKAELAYQRVMAINPEINCTIYNKRLSTDNVATIFHQYDIITDGTDNFPTRYLINDACVKYEKVNVFASVQRYEGQVAVFNAVREDGSRSANYRDLFLIPPLENTVPNCAEAGVLGPVVGMVACIQAQEAIKIASGIGSTLTDKMLTIDVQDYQMLQIKLRVRNDHHYKNESRDKIELIAYDDICKLDIANKYELNFEQLLQKLKSSSNVKVIDIREPSEYELHNIGAENIPKGDFTEIAFTENNPSIYILHCQSGKRSRTLIDEITRANPDYEIYHLTGGLNQWTKELGKFVKLPLSV